jgi:4-amino-4-deoxy-L-arabinose transferase-like glycosyltransferase
MLEMHASADRVTEGPGATRSTLHLVTLSFILAAYLFIGSLYAVKTPAWQVPDEPAHYNYIRHLVEQRTFPVLQPGDYDQDYLERLKGEKFPAALPIDSLEYEDHQPPLYYLLAAPLFAATAGNLVVLRLFSLALGAGVVIFAFLIAREVLPDDDRLALVTAGFVAFVPQHVAMMAGVNNDALAELLMASGLWLTLKFLKRPPLVVGPWPLALVLGLAFLTKSTIYPLAIIVGLMLLLKARRDGWRRRQLLVTGLQVFVPALILGALWWGRNIAVYGGTDLLGLQRHNQVVLGQPRTSEWLATLGAVEVARRFIQTSFQSFWGQFGWMGVVMDQRVYLALLAYSLFILIGFAGAAIRARRAGGLTREQWEASALPAVALLLTAGLYLYYNLTFVQHQGRYLFPALPVIAMGAAVGIRQWADWLVRGARLRADGVRRGVEFALSLSPIALMAVLDLFALYRFVVPALG